MSITSTEEATLDTAQCATIAMYMYKEWQKAMEPPLYSYKTFPDWLQSLTHPTKQTLEEKE